MVPITVSAQGVCVELSRLNTRKSAGPDGVPATFLKNTASSLCYPLAALFNQSLDSGYVPSHWRTAHIIPLHKKDSRSNPSNYRPISLTSIICKTLEHIVTSNIAKHLESNRLLSHSQHGFRNHRSCESAILNFMHDVTSLLSNSPFSAVDCIFIDIRKAFDSVPHEQLVSVCSTFGLDVRTLSWIRSFVLNRKQRVVVDGVSSEWAWVHSGVPQGCVISPLLFIMYMDSIVANLHPSSKVGIYADDTYILQRICSVDDCQNLQHSLDQLSDWSAQSQLEFSAPKSAFMRISALRHIDPFIGGRPTYFLAREIVPKVEEIKLLGLRFTHELSFVPQIDHIVTSCTRVLSFLRRNFWDASRQAKTTLVNSLLFSRIDYLSGVYDLNFRKADLKPIDKLQNQAIRFIFRDPSNRTSTSARRNELGLPLLSERRKSARVNYISRILSNNLTVPSFTFHIDDISGAVLVDDVLSPNSGKGLPAVLTIAANEYNATL